MSIQWVFDKYIKNCYVVDDNKKMSNTTNPLPPTTTTTTTSSPTESTTNVPPSPNNFEDLMEHLMDQLKDQLNLSDLSESLLSGDATDILSSFPSELPPISTIEEAQAGLPEVEPQHIIVPGVYSPPSSLTHTMTFVALPITMQDIYLKYVIGREGIQFRRITRRSGISYLWYNREKHGIEIWWKKYSQLVQCEKRLCTAWLYVFDRLRREEYDIHEENYGWLRTQVNRWHWKNLPRWFSGEEVGSSTSSFTLTLPPLPRGGQLRIHIEEAS